MLQAEEKARQRREEGCRRWVERRSEENQTGGGRRIKLVLAASGELVKAMYEICRLALLLLHEVLRGGRGRGLLYLEVAGELTPANWTSLQPLHAVLADTEMSAW
mmetsp:Transcript_945/g.2996  ORF Transcript_945/g.2996 Transcript_945/m.2996 type:complete len:105 (+) Transcript_945:1744-2058(+)